MNNFFPKDAGDGENSYWVIKGILLGKPYAYYKQGVGWVAINEATKYTDEEKENLSKLPGASGWEFIKIKP